MSSAQALETKANTFARIERFQLDNGVESYFVPIDNAEFFKLTVYVWAGSVDEVDGHNNGVAHFLEHLMFNQRGLTEVLFEREMQAMGGSYNAFTYKPYTRYFVYLPKAYLERGAEWLWKVVMRTELGGARIPEILQVIDRENAWQAPTWLDRIESFFLLEGSLKETGFWQRYLDLPEYDVDVGGRPEISRHLNLEKAVEFHKRYYTTANMSLIYVGPHSQEEVQTTLEGLAAEIPGLEGGLRNVRLNFTEPKPKHDYRFLTIEDQDPSVTQGFLVNDLKYNELDEVTLLTELMKRYLFENIRFKSAETYSIASDLKTFRGRGYLIFTSQASRLNFGVIRDFLGDTLWQPLGRVLEEDYFNQAKRDYMQFVRQRLHQPNFVDAFVGFLIREHPRAAPSKENLDWLKRIESIGYHDWLDWHAKFATSNKRYTYLEAPSQIVPYENLPLLIFAFIFAWSMWRLYYFNPLHVRHVRTRERLTFWPLNALATAAAAAVALLAFRVLLFTAERGFDWLLDAQWSMYLVAYLHTITIPILLVTCFAVTLSPIMRQVLITDQGLTFKSVHYRSVHISFRDIKELSVVPAFSLFKFKGWPLHLFLRKGIRIEKAGGNALLFRVPDAENFLEITRLAMKGKRDDARQLTFPGMSRVHIESSGPHDDTTEETES